MGMHKSGNEIVRVGAAEAEVIEHSIVHHHDISIPLVTVRTRYWRPIHSEVMTHKVFSRNARSSRAVPTPRLLKEEPFYPIFGQNIAGMQAGEELSPQDQDNALMIWEQMIRQCRDGVRELNALGVHKQWANRPLEWFGWIDTLITATDWANFYHLRDHPDAAPEIQDLARAIKQAVETSIPTVRSPYDDNHQTGWHLPYCTATDRLQYNLDFLKRISTARCSRISYTPFDADKADIEADIKQFERLLGSSPLHASPAEHQACPDMMVQTYLGRGINVSHWAHQEEHANFYGWRQFRKQLPNENFKDSHYA